MEPDIYIHISLSNKKLSIYIYIIHSFFLCQSIFSFSLSLFLSFSLSLFLSFSLSLSLSLTSFALFFLLYPSFYLFSSFTHFPRCSILLLQAFVVPNANVRYVKKNVYVQQCYSNPCTKQDLS